MNRVQIFSLLLVSCTSIHAGKFNGSSRHEARGDSGMSIAQVTGILRLTSSHTQFIMHSGIVELYDDSADENARREAVLTACANYFRQYSMTKEEREAYKQQILSTLEIPLEQEVQIPRAKPLKFMLEENTGLLHFLATTDFMKEVSGKKMPVDQLTNIIDQYCERYRDRVCYPNCEPRLARLWQLGVQEVEQDLKAALIPARADANSNTHAS